MECREVIDSLKKGENPSTFAGTCLVGIEPVVWAQLSM